MSIKEAISKNQQLRCSVKNCPYPRYKLNATCVHHFFKKRLYGSPVSRAIKKKELLYEKAQIVELIERHKGHKGIQKAISWLDKWLQTAGDQLGVPGSYLLKRLHDSGVTGRDLLITCATLWLYSYNNPHLFPDNLSLDYGVAHQLAKMIPMEYRMSRNGKKRAVILKGNEKKAIGQYIRNHIGILFVNICEYLRKIEEKKQQMGVAMARPFEKA
jgi:hypothetical protein